MVSRPSMHRPRLGWRFAVPVLALAAATVVVAALERGAGIPDASVVYMTAVVAAAITTGTVGAAVTAIAAFVVYDFLFTQPYLTLAVYDPHEWLSLVLFLFVGVVVGHLTALQRSRAAVAEAREQEAQALFRVSRELATRESTIQALSTLVQALRVEAGMDRVWIGLGPDDATERVAADTEPDAPAAVPNMHSVLKRMPGDEPARWVRIHQAAFRPRREPGTDAYRVRITAGGVPLGSIWGTRRADRGEPDRTPTRLLAAAADQVGQVLAHDRLAAEAQAAEIARQSDEIKSALLQSVSHDLRTPLATIRAAAGSLRPGSGLSAPDRAESAEAIDREVEYLNRLVTNLLDLSRIEAGALRAERDVFELDDAIGPTLERVRPRLLGRPMTVELHAPPVIVDAVFLDEAVTNVLENAIKYTPATAAIRVTAIRLADEPRVRLTIEDAGPGAPRHALPLLFDKFYRAPDAERRSRSGVGIGLAVVRGLVEAMGGRVAARRSELGGLAIDLDLPAASVPADLVAA